MIYRRDIDGLRAVAVLPVLLYHAGIPGFSGGFVGVDVFFVISGYLITSLIREEVERGAFSTVRFYERRVRRIFPALFAVLLGVSIAAALLYLPNDIERYGVSLLGATFFGSNIIFWQQANYFGVAATLKPLLQTWSLAVEEQFYILFPLFVALVHRLAPRHLAAAVGAVFAASFALSMWATSHAPGAAYYMAPPRAWELLMGALLALGALPELRSQVQRELAAFGGLLLIAVAVNRLDTSTPFPGLAALLPCVGATLLLQAGRNGTSWTGRALSGRLPVGIGLISYSLYLWHWPALAMVRYVQVRELSPLVATACLGVSTLLAIASWRWVERPFRSAAQVSRRRIFQYAAAAMLVAGLAGVGMMTLARVIRPVSPTIRTILDYVDYPLAKAASRSGVCFATTEMGERYDADLCLKPKAGRPGYLLIGDSHAAHLWYGLDQVLPEINVMQSTAAGCKPLVSVLGHEDTACLRLANRTLRQHSLADSVGTVLLASHWQAADAPDIAKTVAYLRQRGKQVVLFGPIPEYELPLPSLIARGMLVGAPDLPQQYRLRDTADTERAIEAVAKAAGIRYVSLLRSLCPAPRPCRTLAGPRAPMQFDTAHLTEEGSVILARGWKAAGLLP